VAHHVGDVPHDLIGGREGGREGGRGQNGAFLDEGEVGVRVEPVGGEVDLVLLRKGGREGGREGGVRMVHSLMKVRSV